MKLLKQNFVIYGLILCGILLISLAIMHLTGQYNSFEKQSPLSLVMFIAPLIIWYLGLKAKKKQLHNQMTFKQGWREGILISLVFATISPLIFAAYYQFINPRILDTYVRETYQMTGTPLSMVLTVDIFIQFFGSLMLGTIYTAILSVSMKT